MQRQLVGVAGLGLIGGSFAMDLVDKDHGVVGYDINEECCAKAMDMGIVHQASSDINVLDDCTAILLATPVCSIAKVMEQVSRLEANNLLALFDTGSTKALPSEEASSLGAYSRLFVPCHPVAGVEHSGIEHASQGLFRGKKVIICRLPGSDDSAFEIAKGLWQDCDASLVELDVAEHDRLFATVSHLPHMLAFLLVGMLSNRADRDRLLEFAASGFTDFTRIASSDPDMWSDICMANGDNLVKEIASYQDELAQMREAIANRDRERLHAYFGKARDIRNNWLAAKAGKET